MGDAVALYFDTAVMYAVQHDDRMRSRAKQIHEQLYGQAVAV
jgi:hypothetical protein